MISKIFNFFTPVSQARHRLDVQIDQLQIEEAERLKAVARQETEENLKKARLANRIAGNQRRLETSIAIHDATINNNIRTPREIVQDQIDELFEDVFDLQGEYSPNNSKKHWNKRPVDWIVIAEHGAIYGWQSALDDEVNYYIYIII
jgi:hypothetical protein